MWNLDHLCGELKKIGVQIHLETSGAYKMSGKFDWVCLSPKKLNPPLEEIKHLTNELKVIIANKTDFNWAVEQRKSIKSECKFYLQPEWSKKDNMLPKIIDFVQLNPQWTISLQTHKFMNIP
jgi:7-carboxy-7-deazaguanine synthase